MIVIALGANQPSPAGPPEQTLRAALMTFAEHGIAVRAVSRFYLSPAWPNPSDPPFINAVVAVATELGPAALLAQLHAVEDRFGRLRRVRNAPRTLDLDIIDYDGRIESLPGGPVLPHPRLRERPFVLAPFRDVAPDWRHPATGEPVLALLRAAETAENRAIAVG